MCVRRAQGKQAHFGFGAAANLVHPATGYSILRSLSEAPAVADTIVARLREQQQEEASAVASFEMQTSASVAEAAWGTLWSDERRRQSSFQVRTMHSEDCHSIAGVFTLVSMRPLLFHRLRKVDVMRTSAISAMAPNPTAGVRNGASGGLEPARDEPVLRHVLRAAGAPVSRLSRGRTVVGRPLPFRLRLLPKGAQRNALPPVETPSHPSLRCVCLSSLSTSRPLSLCGYRHLGIADRWPSILLTEFGEWCYL
jgi:hypothetical protein